MQIGIKIYAHYFQILWLWQDVFNSIWDLIVLVFEYL